MEPVNPLPQFGALLNESEFVFAVFYRGSWCPFCMAYLTEFASLAPAIRRAGGTPVIITAEADPSLQDKTRKTTGYDGIAFIDPTHSIAKQIEARHLLHVAITEKDGYEHGVAQQDFLVIKKDRTVLESWAIVPSVMNLGGAKDRPLLGQVWQNVEAKLAGKKNLPFTTYSKLGMSVIAKKLAFW